MKPFKFNIILVQNKFYTTEALRAQRNIFLFGGEPFDRLKALSKVEGIPPNKKGFAIEEKAHDKCRSH